MHRCPNFNFVAAHYKLPMMMMLVIKRRRRHFTNFRLELVLAAGQKVPPCVWGECDFYVNWLHVSRIRPTHWRMNDDFDINQRRCWLTRNIRIKVKVKRTCIAPFVKLQLKALRYGTYRCVCVNDTSSCKDFAFDVGK